MLWFVFILLLFFFALVNQPMNRTAAADDEYVRNYIIGNGKMQTEFPRLTE